MSNHPAKGRTRQKLPRRLWPIGFFSSLVSLRTDCPDGKLLARSAFLQDLLPFADPLADSKDRKAENPASGARVAEKSSEEILFPPFADWPGGVRWFNSLSFP